MKSVEKFAKFIVIFTLIFSWIFGGWPQFLNFPPKIQKVEAVTALTAYLTSTNDTLVTTARQLTNSAPASETSVTNKTGKSTGWGELRAQGNTSAWAAGASEPAPTGYGFLWDVTTLEGQQILSGNWTPTVNLSTSSGTVTGVLHARAYVRSSAGAYTLIVDVASVSINITGTATAYTLPATSAALTSFTTGNKLYIDYMLNITGNTSTSNTATTRLYENGGVNEQMVTPGYQPPPLSITAPASVQMPNYTLGGVGYSERNFSDVSGLVQVTASAGFTVTVSSTNLTGTNNTISNANIKLKTDGTASTNPTQILNCTGYSGITETASGEYALSSAQTIVTTSSGSGTCDIYPTIRVYISASPYIEQDTGTLTFTVTSP